MIPYLGIDNEASFEWKMTGDIRKEGIQTPKWMQEIEIPNEEVQTFIRLTKNITSVWTRQNHLYEIRKDITRIDMQSDITPTYMNGSYIGWKDYKMHIASRKHTKTHNISIKVTDALGIMYSHYVVLNTNEGCYRANVKDFQTLIPLENTYLYADYHQETVVLYTDEIIVFNCWKVKHRIKASNVEYCKIHSGIILTIQGPKVVSYDPFGGEQLFHFETTWHKPHHVYYEHQIVYTIDNDILAMWTVTPQKVSSWRPMTIHPKLYLLSTVHIGRSKCIAFFDSKLLVQQKKVLYLSLYPESATFTSGIKTLRWIKDPVNDLPLDSISILKSTLPIWSNKILKHIIDYGLHCNYNLRKLFKVDTTIRTDFEYFLNLYVQNHLKDFDNREYCSRYVEFSDSLSMTIDMNVLPKPTVSENFLLWIETKTVCKECIKKAVEDQNIIETEYLNTVQDHILDWDIVLKAKPLEYLTVNNITRSCREGYTTEWVRLFQNLESFQNVKNAWEAVYRYVLDVNVLNSYSYPNTNDGTWEMRDIILPNTWIIVDEVVRNTNGVDNIDTPVMTWIPNRSPPSTVVERALVMLDKTFWDDKGSKWVKYTSGELEPDTDIKCKEGNGTVLSWPLALLENGTKEIISNVYEYKHVYFNFKIDSRVRKQAVNFIREQVSIGKMMEINPMYRSVMISLLDTTMYLSTIFCEEKISCIACGFDNILWVGEQNGSILLIKNGKKTQRMFVHKSAVKDIHFFKSIGVTASKDGTICVWDKTCMVNKITTDISIQKINIVSPKNIWLLDTNMVTWCWNSIGYPKQIHTAGAGTSNYGIASYNDSVAVLTTRLNVWYGKYPYTIIGSNIDSAVTCLCMISEEDYIYGTKFGSVVLCSIMDSEKIILWQTKHQRITTLLAIGDYCFVGTQLGRVACVPLELHQTKAACWDLGSTVVGMTHDDSHVYATTMNGGLYSISYDIVDTRCLYRMMVVFCREWPNHVMIPKNIEQIQRNIIHLYKMGKKQNFVKIFELCLEDKQHRKLWCKPDIMEVLLEGMKHFPSDYKKIMNKLFCFTGSVFTCAICQSQSVSDTNTLSLLTTCGHRFHTKCIKQLMLKNSEWDDICRHEWALTSELNCPSCRAPFSENNILLDKDMTDICAFDSDEDV